MIKNNKKYRISAHRTVLAACSHYFDKKLSITQNDSNHQRITLEQFSGDTMKELIGFCYSGNANITMENVKELSLAAKILRFDKVLSKCKRFLVEQMVHHHEVSYFVQSLDFFQSKQLKAMATYYSNNFFSEMENFEYFNRLNIDKVIKILCDDNLVVQNEIDVFNATMAWFHYDAANRKSCLFHLLKCIRYNYVDDEVSYFLS